MEKEKVGPGSLSISLNDLIYLDILHLHICLKVAFTNIPEFLGQASAF